MFASRSRDPLLQAAAASALGGFLGGVQLALLSGLLELKDFKSIIAHTTQEKTQVSVAYLIGSIAFALPAGPFCDMFGRRLALLLVAAGSIFASVIMMFTTSTTIFSFGRLLAGAAYGLANVVCPMYNSEIASKSQRGLFVNMYQLALTLGILSSQIAGAVTVWWNLSFRVPLFLAELPCIFMLIAVFVFTPESPAWLVSQGRHADAELSRTKLGVNAVSTQDYSEESGLLLEQTSASSSAAAKPRPAPRSSEPEASINLFSLVTDPSARRRLIIAAGVLTFQQLTGINNVILYAPTMIMKMLGPNVGGSGMLPFIASAVIGLMNVLFTGVSLLLIESYGRKTLLLACTVPMFVGLSILSVLNMFQLGPIIGVLCIVLFIVGFAIAWGPVPFLVSSEVFPVQYRGLGMTVSVLIMSFASILVTSTFLELHEFFGSKVFITYALLTALAGVFVYYVVPETRNLSAEEIDEMLS